MDADAQDAHAARIDTLLATLDGGAGASTADPPLSLRPADARHV
jgi:hypothetical protein